MSNCTAEARERQTRKPSDTTTMMVEQRQWMIEWAWLYAQPTIRSWEKMRPDLDLAGHVGLRLSRYIDNFDAGRSSLSTWARNHAVGACLDANRDDTGVVHFARNRDWKNVYQLQALEYITDSNHVRDHDCLTVRDQAGHLEQIDGLKSLLKGTNKVERLIVLGYYWQGQTMKEVGAGLGLSESRVSQIHSALIKRLRDRMGDLTPAA